MGVGGRGVSPRPLAEGLIIFIPYNLAFFFETWDLCRGSLTIDALSRICSGKLTSYYPFLASLSLLGWRLVVGGVGRGDLVVVL